jgi:transcriptional regulator with GAF, ATPase, and Fis domain
MPEAYREDYLTNRHRKAIVEDTENFLQTERKRIISGMRQVLDIVQELHRSSERSLDELLSSVLDQMIDFTGAERGILFNIDPRSPDDPDQNEDAAYVTRDWLPSSEGLPSVWRVSVASARGFGQQDLNKQSAKASGTVIKRILKENGPILTADAIEDMRFSHSGSIAKLGMRSILAIPLRYDKQINGVVYLDSQEIKRFSDEDTGLLDMLGDHMGPVVERAQQREHVRAVTNMFPRIIGASEALLSVLDDASKIAGADVPVLILGSTGTGKELLAQGVHNASTRSRQSFVAFNCATLSSDLALADLFGAERGAYTGAHQARMGYFEQADGGTLFLDEIGDTPLEVQTQLLRVLQEGVYRRVGGTKDRKVDVRIIAATHWDLEKRIADGLFREDLYFRLKVVPLKLPDLRNRRRDIPTLVHFFFNLFMEKHKLSLAPPSKEVISALQEFPWPGNIRQLRNALQQAMLFSDGALTLDAIRSAAGAVENQPVEAQIPEQPVGGYGPAAFRGPAQPGAYPPGMGAWSPYPYPMWPMPYPGYPPQSGYPQGTLPPNAFGQSPQQWPAAWPQQYPSWPPTAPPTQAVPPQGSQEPGAPPAGTSQEAHSYSNAMARHRYELALKALQASNGNKTQAAAMMGITRQSLYRILAQGKA